jgi:hypothetical protein
MTNSTTPFPIGQSLSSQAVTATTNVQNEIFQHRTSPDPIVEAITSLRDEITLLRGDRARDMEVIIDLQRKLNTLSQDQITVKGGTFTLFPNLPLQLRDQVWEFALGVPRAVTVELRKCCRYKCSQIVVPTFPPHAILKANCESRHQALKVLHRYTTPDERAPKLFLNPEINTL